MIRKLHRFAESDHKIADLLRKSVHSSIWISFDGVCAAIMSTIALGQPHSIGAYAITFLMVYAMYNMDRFSGNLEDQQNHPKRHAFIKKYRQHLLKTSTAAVVIALIIAFSRNTNTLLMVVSPIVLALIYSLKILPRTRKVERIKDTTLGKPIILSLCWAIITIGVVAAYYDTGLTLGVIVIAFIIFSRSFLSSVVCDIRDVAGDRKHKTPTIPVIFGESKTRLLLYAYLTSLVLFTQYTIFSNILPKLMSLVNLTSIQAYYYIHETQKPGPHIRTLTDVIVDSEFMVMGIAAIIGQFLLN
ncbi:MAG: UbiA family prenyltransferase [Candidatus Altiarchaeota archaeon]